MSPTILEFLSEVIPKEQILLNEEMKNHTTFRIGGPVSALLQVDCIEQVEKLVPYFHNAGREYCVLGNGSNVLVGDKGIEGCVLQIGPKMGKITVEGCKITVEAGALLSKVSKVAQQHGLSGLEFAAGIPGTIGGAVVMNAGAYGGEMKQVVQSVTLLTQEGSILELSANDMEFGYRTSIVKKTMHVVLQVVMELKPADSDEIKQKMDDFNKQRKCKQPLEYPSAGSTFKRPEGNFAGKLIMDAGLRGFRIGDAQVSEKHCGFVINIGNATAADVKDVIEEVSRRVYDMFDVKLETEVVFWGEF